MSEQGRSGSTAEMPKLDHPPVVRISSFAVSNFRLIKSAEMVLDPTVTVLVGRNNTGKTSLAEVLVRFLGHRPFGFADFSSASYGEFLQSYLLYRGGKEFDSRSVLPSITLTINIEYDGDNEYGPLSAVIIDLDPDCRQAQLRFSYALKDGQLGCLFDGLAADGTESATEPDLQALIAHVKDRVPSLYGHDVIAIDPGDPSNTRSVSVDAVQRLLTVDFLHAQRGLDDDKERPKNLISHRFQSLYSAAAKAEEETSHRETARLLADAIADIQNTIGQKVDEVMAGVVPTLEQFGYPGLNGQKLATKTELDVQQLLANHTEVHYEGIAGVTLPESYSGLGSRNLVLILLTLLSYYRAYAAQCNPLGLHLVFIEEPEAHLHPQMQEVFIQQLNSLARLFPTIDGSPDRWSVQFVVSTHSSHVANKATFAAIRYFLVDAQVADDAVARHADILDLSKAPGINDEFLHRYLTLTRADLFFADKAILVEGTSERLIVPKAIARNAPSLTRQYITLLEVGGAHAYLFFPLLDFLRLPSLIVTDLDPVAKIDSRRRAVCVNRGEYTSNETIKSWFANKEITPAELLSKARAGETVTPNRYLAYQVPEADGGPCGRSFEEAFILANPELFDFTIDVDNAAAEEASTSEAEQYKKTDFALRFAVGEGAWKTPRYISEGLNWLLALPSPSEKPGVASENDTASLR
ncbi:AAA family ATPase [Nocardia nova]|uniref:AAA family ATPase n=1 Tax=Nocardia nova TaxID=37330 RepID=UPI0033EE24A0